MESAQSEIVSHSSSSKLLQINAAERRKKYLVEVLLGDLPPDFLRLVVPQAEIAQAQQANLPVYIADPAMSTQHSLIQAQHAYYSFMPPNTRGRILIEVVEAKLVKNYGLVRMDPYCRVRVGSAVFETPTNTNGGKTPRWNRIIDAYLPHGVESIYLQIFDERAFTVDECVAWAHIVLPNGVFNGEVIDDWYQLSGPQGDRIEGVINLITSFTPLETQSTPSQNVQQQQPQPPVEIITEEELNELNAMFPSLDIDVIKCILEEKRGNKEATVSAILEMTAEQ